MAENYDTIMELTNIRDSRESFTLCRAGEEFRVRYICPGMDCLFACDLTDENVRGFEYALDDILDGISAYNEAVLVNYGTEQRSLLSVSPAGRGIWSVNGRFLNKQNNYASGISFSFEADYAEIIGIFGHQK